MHSVRLQLHLSRLRLQNLLTLTSPYVRQAHIAFAARSVTVSSLHSASNLNCVEIIFPLRLGIFSNHDSIMNSLLTDDTYYIICIYIDKVHFNYSTGHTVLISVEIERPILKCIGSSQCMILKKVRCLLICDPEYCAMKNVSFRSYGFIFVQFYTKLF